MTLTRPLFFLIPCFLVVPALASGQQRPLVTEDPETIGEGRVLVEGGFDYRRSVEFPASGLEGHLLRAPLFGVSVGISSIAELQLDGGLYNHLAITRRRAAPLSALVTATGDSASSIEDLVVGTKIRLAAEGVSRPSFAVRFATKLPNASNESGLGLDTTDFYVSVLGAKTVQSVRVVGNVGLGILGDPTNGHRQNDVLTYGVSFARALTDAAEVVGELNGRIDTRNGEPPPGTESSSTARLGGRYTVGGLRVDAAVLLGITSQRSVPSASRPASPTCSRPSASRETAVRIIKAHAYGNDFLLVQDEGLDHGVPSLARSLCHRHLGIGADGLILYAVRDRGASMRLLNADGSWSELSGNGLRCLAALVARAQDLRAGSVVTVDTPAGVKTLELLDHPAGRYVFRAAMGTPTELRRERIEVLGEAIEASVLRMGNPQCVVLGPLPDRGALRTTGPGALDPPDVSGRHQRGVRAGRGAGPRSHPHLGAGRGPDDVVGHGDGRGRRRRRGARRRSPRARCGRARGHSAGRVARRRGLPDRMG